MSRSRKMDEQKQSKMCGRKGFAFARLMFLKFGGIRVSAPQESAGGMWGGVLGFWRRGASRKRNANMIKSFNERF
ncbi:hypothetical protein A3B01_00405 [Candidatus Nomurabacteria bacterium RIFCSPLOWO2_01_FULL_41_52b]|nr:MAG: hypothetical protein A3B01_00405 [Candidatus Nomurabacteria bacterium RIFCSPLOWO2_01_FULL_41_52b]